MHRMGWCSNLQEKIMGTFKNLDKAIDAAIDGYIEIFGGNKLEILEEIRSDGPLRNTIMMC